MSAKTIIEEVVSRGMSHGHSLMLQFLACPPNVSFALHSHAIVELDIPLIGELWKRCIYDAVVRPTLPLRKSPLEVVQERDQRGSELHNSPSDADMKEISQWLMQTVSEKSPLGKHWEVCQQGKLRRFHHLQQSWEHPSNIHEGSGMPHTCFMVWYAR